MKKIVAIVMIIATILLAGCSNAGVPQADYDALLAAYESVAAERDALLQDRPDHTGKTEAADEGGTQKTETESKVEAGEFDADLVLSQLEVTEYFYDGKWYDYTKCILHIGW